MPKEQTPPENEAEVPQEERMLKTLAGTFKTVTALDFDTIALLGLTGAIYVIDPHQTAKAVMDILTEGLTRIGSIIGEPIGDVLESGGDALGDLWDWLTGG